jgi:hypothetical protein
MLVERIGTCYSENWLGYGSIPINSNFRGMNIHLPAILMFTRGTRFWHTAIKVCYTDHVHDIFVSQISVDKGGWLETNIHLPKLKAHLMDLWNVCTQYSKQGDWRFQWTKGGWTFKKHWDHLQQGQIMSTFGSTIYIYPKKTQYPVDEMGQKASLTLTCIILLPFILAPNMMTSNLMTMW